MHRAAVIGLGRFGMTLARELARYGAEVIAVDNDEAHVEEIRDRVSVAVVADGSQEKVLRDLGVGGVDVAVVSMGDNFEGLQLTVVLLKRRLGVKRVVAKATSPLRERILRSIGCDEVISPERETALRLAHHLVLPRVLEHVALGPGKALVQVVTPPSMVGKSIKDTGVRHRFGVNIVAVKRRVLPDGRPASSGERTLRMAISPLTGLPVAEEVVRPAPTAEAATGGEASPALTGGPGEAREEVLTTPSPEEVLLAGDVLVVIGEDEGINRMVEA
ncbi:MAG: TrkA family potassium uptake protein [Planctomycetaceae bacterium]|nr:TrkA family potassium uptake protein [Planctomycetota bacterium]NUN52412.1 TrkA family potassium uptake protein [Planctomycetaceae bacterium]